MLNRDYARYDLRECRVRNVNERVFALVTLPPATRFVAYCDDPSLFWSDMRTVGTNPTMHDVSEHVVLCDMIAAHHDYPSASALGHMIAD